MRIALVVVVAVLVAQVLAVVFWAIPRAEQAWAWQGYYLGRKHQRDGTPPPVVLVPARKGHES